MDLPTAKREYETLRKLDETSDPTERRRRGIRLEEIISSILEASNLEPRIRFRPLGEELDGSFVLGDRHFLVEAKWHSRPLPASQVYAFKGKVDGKLAGTLGVFISLSGYGEDAVDALSRGKVLNVILFDRDDFEAALDHSFRKVLLVKLRKAAEEGTIFYPYASESAFTGRPGDVIARHRIPTEDIANFSDHDDLLIITEGAKDAILLEAFAKHILKERGLDRSVSVIPANGKAAIPMIANALSNLRDSRARIVLVADSDENQEATLQLIGSSLTGTNCEVIVVDPNVMAWNPESPDEEALKAQAESLQQSDLAFAQFSRTVTGSATSSESVDQREPSD